MGDVADWSCHLNDCQRLSCQLLLSTTVTRVWQNQLGRAAYVALFKKKQPVQPAAPPPPKSCICGVSVPANDFSAHLDVHICEVLTPGGYPGRSHICPVCGPSEEVYGQPGEHPISLRNMSHALFERHCREFHGVGL